MINVNEYKRKGKKGYALYLDYYVNGERKQESTGLILLDGKDAVTKQLNKETRTRFDHLIFEKKKQLMDGIITPQSIKRQRMDFFKYFETYMLLNPSRERRNKATLNKLKSFWENQMLRDRDMLPLTEVTENMLKLFSLYLAKQLTGETPYDYFKALKRVLKQATKEGLFTRNPAEDIKISMQSNDPKATITKEEVALLEATYCGNDNVKRAFLFSCYTGIRFCDVKVLRWQNITPDNRMKIVQVKTKEPLDQLLIGKAQDLLGVRKGDSSLVFQLPTGNGTNKNLKLWSKKAGLDKKVTFHVSRHSFATSVFDGTRDILTTSKALGHKSIKETQRYIRVPQTTVDEALLTLA